MNENVRHHNGENDDDDDGSSGSDAAYSVSQRHSLPIFPIKLHFILASPCTCHSVADSKSYHEFGILPFFHQAMYHVGGASMPLCRQMLYAFVSLLSWRFPKSHNFYPFFAHKSKMWHQSSNGMVYWPRNGRKPIRKKVKRDIRIEFVVHLYEVWVFWVFHPNHYYYLYFASFRFVVVATKMWNTIVFLGRHTSVSRCQYSFVWRNFSILFSIH